MAALKHIPANHEAKLETTLNVSLSDFPNFHKTGSIRGMKKLYYGKDALLVKCGSYIYNVTSMPAIYEAANF